MEAPPGRTRGAAPPRGAFVRVWEFAPEGCAGERACPRAAQQHEFFDALDTNDLFVADVDGDPGPELVAEYLGDFVHSPSVSP